MLIDEADTFLSKYKDLTGILNSGHTRRQAYVMRASKGGGEPMKYSTFCPKAIAGIGQFASATIQDRSIKIELRRKMLTEKVDRLSDVDPTTEDRFAMIRLGLERWSDQYSSVVAKVNPNIPDELNDRAKDNWRPLLAIADIVGGMWSSKAREAARSIAKRCNEDDSEDVSGVTILAMIRELFAQRGTDKLSTMEILAKVNDNIDSMMKPHRLARMLKEFGIHPITIRTSMTSTPKGYRLEDFSDAFRRYLPNLSG